MYKLHVILGKCCTPRNKATSTSPAKLCKWVFISGKEPAEQAPFSDVTSMMGRITNKLLGSGWDKSGNDGRDLLVVLMHPQAGPGKGEANS